MNPVVLIRHGATAGNLKKRYIGRTDQPLCAAGEAQLRRLADDLPPCDHLFCSPLLRCRQTAALLYPGHNVCLVDDLRECDFGKFEGKTADELAGDADYHSWLAAGCLTPPPGGEAVDTFKQRCTQAFVRILTAAPPGDRIGFIIHGGCIMAILERFAEPRIEFYQAHLDNGHYLAADWRAGRLFLMGGSLC